MPSALRTLLGTLVLVHACWISGCISRSASSPPPKPPALASWNDTPTIRAIASFVERTTTPGSAEFVPPGERLAVFDNDGTLWAEQPVYVQLAFAVDRVRMLAPQHPEWNQSEPFRSILAGDLNAALAGGENAVAQIILATHAGMTSDEFAQAVSQWITTARHPTTGRLYTEMVYQPMLELLDYLRDNGFTTCIVSGGGIEFMRPWAERVYGIPPEQVVGSSIKTAFEWRDGVPVLMRQPEIGSINDGPEKPVNIDLHFGRRPIMAFGNSDGDLQMIQWTTIGQSPSLGVIIHHTDADREWAYDHGSPIGRLERALDEAPRNGWVVVDMKTDWARVLP